MQNYASLAAEGENLERFWDNPRLKDNFVLSGHKDTVPLEFWLNTDRVPVNFDRAGPCPDLVEIVFMESVTCDVVLRYGKEEVKRWRDPAGDYEQIVVQAILEFAGIDNEKD